MANQENIKQAESEWKQAVGWFYSDEETKTREVEKLKKLWEEAQPMTDKELYAVRQITWLSRCNWNLRPNIKSLIEAIGKGENANMRIGHNYSITNERWKKAWAYYFSLKKWLPVQGKYTGLPILLDFCDPNKAIQSHIIDLLGKKTKLKELYIELFSYSLEFKLMGRHPDDSKKILATNAAVELLINEVKKHDYDERILAAVQINPELLSEGKLVWYEICHHKFFRRCDIILSSIGENKWRGTFIEKSTETEELQDLLLRYSLTLDTWISNQNADDEFTISNHALLGKQTNKKLFQVSLLNAFLKGEMEKLNQYKQRRS
ncbi:MAG: hypothetical protein ACFFFT_07395 [Candidatus Thorarchaeota archaeon]